MKYTGLDVSKFLFWSEGIFEKDKRIKFQIEVEVGDPRNRVNTNQSKVSAECKLLHKTFIDFSRYHSTRVSINPVDNRGYDYCDYIVIPHALITRPNKSIVDNSYDIDYTPKNLTKTTTITFLNTNVLSKIINTISSTFNLKLTKKQIKDMKEAIKGSGMYSWGKYNES